MAISEIVLEEVKQKNDIVDVISQYVSLKRQGKYLKGLCPFHEEKTPSFTVTPEKQIFYCFGCQAGGDVLKFIMLKENLNFPQAVRYLADKAGIELPNEDSGANDETYKLRQSLYNTNALAAKYFNYLLVNHTSGKQGLEYFAKRGINEQIINKFHLGYAPSGHDTLYQFLLSRGTATKDMVNLGLARKTNQGKVYDQFRNRVMFPIIDVNNRVIAFGGRVLDKSLPKYINSAESEVFSKSSTLYGINVAVDGIRKQDAVIIMEGYMDVIRAHQHGIDNVVATLGTALTVAHARILRRYTNQVIMSFDADAAGVKAALRGLDIMQEQGFHIQILTIPDGKDPDEYIANHGADAFRQLCNTHTQSLVEFKLQQVLPSCNLNLISGKIKALSEVLPNLARVTSEVELEDFITKISLELNLSKDTVVIELRKFRRQKNPQDIHRLRDKTGIKRNNINDKDSDVDAVTKAEQLLVRLMIENRTYLASIQTEIGLDFTRDEGLNYIISTYFDMVNSMETVDLSQLAARLADSPYSNLFSRLLMLELPQGRLEDTLSGCIQTLKGSMVKDRKLEVLRLIAEAEKHQDWEKLNRLMLEYQQLL